MKTEDLLDELDASYEELCDTVKATIKQIPIEELKKWHEKIQKSFDYRFVINDTKDLYYCWMPYDPDYVKDKIKVVLKTAKNLIKDLKTNFLKNEK